MKRKMSAILGMLALVLLAGAVTCPAPVVKATETAAEEVSDETAVIAEEASDETTDETAVKAEETSDAAAEDADRIGIVLDEGYREEFENLSKACEDTSWISLYKPTGIEMAEDGSAIAFETTDLDGNTVRSEDIFGKNKITMVNIWGTFCGPCIQEMPELEVLYGRLADKGCTMIGIVCDVLDAADTRQIETAREIVADTGVTYLNLIPWEGMQDVLAASLIPTTYFIDSQGCIVGEAAVGARGADEYEALLDEILKTIK